MTNFVLIHGSWHGAWCWFKVVPRLRAAGHYVDVVELPGHGRDHTPAHDVTIDSYVEAIHAAIDRAPGPVVLVAHSRGGLAATQAAEGRSERVAGLVYLAAYLLRDGESVLDLAQHDTDSLVLPNLDFDPEGHWDMLREEVFDDALYADCDADDIALAHALLMPEPFAPSKARMRITEERYGGIPRAYIRLTRDRAVSPALQDRMLAALPCYAVRSIEASHSAYFSRPDELAGHLQELAALMRPAATRALA